MIDNITVYTLIGATWLAGLAFGLAWGYALGRAGSPHQAPLAAKAGNGQGITLRPYTGPVGDLYAHPGWINRGPGVNQGLDGPGVVPITQEYAKALVAQHRARPSPPGRDAAREGSSPAAAAPPTPT